LAKSDPRDPRFRPYRVAVLSVYLVLAVGFSLTTLVCTFKSVLEMTPARPSKIGGTLPVRECVDGAWRMWLQLDDHRKGVSGITPARTADADWSRFRVQWLRELREMQARCVSDSGDRKDLEAIFKRLEKLQNLYMTSAVQYAGEIGPSVDSLQADVRRVQATLR
jgi:hypothetical protein